LDALSADKLTYFDIGNNGKEESLVADLAQFSRFANLETLIVHKNRNVTGSLESLKNLQNLERLNVNRTSVYGKIDHLPFSVRVLGYSETKVDGSNKPICGYVGHNEISLVDKKIPLDEWRKRKK